MEASHVVAIVIALISGTFLRDLARWVRSWGNGANERRSELRRAWDASDEEARKRRLVEEHASHLRRLLVAAPCVEPHTIPPYPKYRQEKEAS